MCTHTFFVHYTNQLNFIFSVKQSLEMISQSYKNNCEFVLNHRIVLKSCTIHFIHIKTLKRLL